MVRMRAFTGETLPPGSLDAIPSLSVIPVPVLVPILDGQRPIRGLDDDGGTGIDQPEAAARHRLDAGILAQGARFGFQQKHLGGERVAIPRRLHQVAGNAGVRPAQNNDLSPEAMFERLMRERAPAPVVQPTPVETPVLVAAPSVAARVEPAPKPQPGRRGKPATLMNGMAARAGVVHIAP
jgi:hypothetical protein